MGESIKFAVEYASPFWRENNYSGTLFSQASIIQEMYDHSTADYKGYALKGFLNGGTHTVRRRTKSESNPSNKTFRCRGRKLRGLSRESMA
jgi:monoamine oxidase